MNTRFRVVRRRARWRGLCADRQRHGQYQPDHAADQSAETPRDSMPQIVPCATTADSFAAIYPCRDLVMRIDAVAYGGQNLPMPRGREVETPVKPYTL